MIRSCYHIDGAGLKTGHVLASNTPASQETLGMNK